MIPSQEQYECTLQPYRELEIEVIIKDKNLNTVELINGIVQDGSLNIEADSDIRRSINLSMVLTSDYTKINSSLISQDIFWKAGNIYWFDKFIQIRIGIKHIISNDIVWHNLGYFMINAPSVNFNADSNTLSFEGVDLMAYFTGLRNGQLEGVDFIIPQGTIITEVIEDILKKAGVMKTIIFTPPINVTPYEIRVDIGGTIYDILSQLRDINSNWEMYFNENASFVFRKIPTGNVKTDRVLIDVYADIDLDTVPPPSLTDKELDKLLLEWNLSTDFEQVKNYVEVLGKTHEPNIVAEKVELSTKRTNNDTVIIYTPNLDLQTIPTILPNKDYSILNWVIGFTIGDINLPIESNLDIQYFKLIHKNGIVEGKLLDTSNIPKKIYSNNKTYILKIIQKYDYHTKQNEYKYEFLGGIQAKAIVYENNPDSPFYVGENLDNIIRLVCAGGEYDNIYSDDLAEQRAEYELYLHSRLHDSINIECVPIYWLDVNELIQFTPKKMKEFNKNQKDRYYWLVKSISIDLNIEGTQTINAIKYYPEFPSISN